MREVRFEVEGESVAGRLFDPVGKARGQIVLVHGLLSQSLEFEDLPERLAAKGYRVLALDQRGFGASGGRRGIITQERATADVLGAVEWLRRDMPGPAVALVGHSMGAVFAMRALEADASIRAAILAAPMDTVRAELSPIEFGGYRALHAVSRTGIPVKVPYKYASNYRYLYHDAAAAQRAKAKGVLQKNVDVSNYPAFMAMRGSDVAPRVKQPVLVILADHDRAVKRESSMRVYDALGGPKELASVDSGHSLWGDKDAEKAAALVTSFLDAHLK